MGEKPTEMVLTCNIYIYIFIFYGGNGQPKRVNKPILALPTAGTVGVVHDVPMFGRAPAVDLSQ